MKLTRLVTDPPRRRTPHEWQEQAALLRWAGLHTSQEPRLQWLYAIPNGEARTTRTGGKLERMGLKAGGPDLCLPVPMGWWHGLYLEIKRTQGGSLRPEQQRWLLALDEQGYRCVVCHGWVEAACVLCAYLERADLAAAIR